jgi:hypothetical protein
MAGVRTVKSPADLGSAMLGLLKKRRARAAAANATLAPRPKTMAKAKSRTKAKPKARVKPKAKVKPRAKAKAAQRKSPRRR